MQERTDNVTPLHRNPTPPVFVVTDREGDLPGGGQFLIRILDGAVVLSHRDNPWDSWGRPVRAEIAS